MSDLDPHVTYHCSTNASISAYSYIFMEVPLYLLMKRGKLKLVCDRLTHMLAEAESGLLLHYKPRVETFLKTSG